MTLRELQTYLGEAKREAERLYGADLCGRYARCAFCDRSAPDPCAAAHCRLVLAVERGEAKIDPALFPEPPVKIAFGAELAVDFTEISAAPAAPAAPVEPEAPQIPAAPAAPEAPEPPTAPVAPAAPEAPQIPAAPAAPEPPEIPIEPETTDIPETPEPPAPAAKHRGKGLLTRGKKEIGLMKLKRKRHGADS